MGMIAVLVAGVFFAFQFVEDERKQELNQWQIRLGIVADTGRGDQRVVGKAIRRNPGVDGKRFVTALHDRTGFRRSLGTDGGPGLSERRGPRAIFAQSPCRHGGTLGLRRSLAAGQEVAANVERVGVAGLGLIDAGGVPLVNTPGMPPMNATIAAAVEKALEGKPALIDVFQGASGEPPSASRSPFSLQGDETAGIGAVVGRSSSATIFGNDWRNRETSRKRPKPTWFAKRGDRIYLRAGGRNASVEPFHGGRHAGIGRLLRRRKSRRVRPQTGLCGIRGFDDVPQSCPTSLDLGPQNHPPGSLVDQRNPSSDHSCRPYPGHCRRRGGHCRRLAAWIGFTRRRSRPKIQDSRRTVREFIKVHETGYQQPTHGIVAVDGDTHYTFANEPAAREGGIEPEDMIGKTMASVMGRSRPPPMPRSIRRFWTRGNGAPRFTPSRRVKVSRSFAPTIFHYRPTGTVHRAS